MENQMSLLEVALEIIKAKTEPIDIKELINETLAKKGINDEDGTYAAKLYTDITISSKFVYLGDDKWDLKERQSLDMFDKDGASFNSKDDYEEMLEEDKDNDDTYEYETSDDEDEDEDEDDSNESYDDEDEEDSEDAYEEEDEAYEDEDDAEDSYDDIDEDEAKYNKIMDDYEDLYED